MSEDAHIYGVRALSRRWVSMAGALVASAFLWTSAAFADPPEQKHIGISVEVAVNEFGPPGNISNLTALGGPAEGTVKLTWTAPGDDGPSGTALSYVIRYGTAPVTQATFGGASTYSPVPDWIPIAGGLEEGAGGDRIVSGLDLGVTYYFAIQAFDEMGFNGDWISSLDNPAVNTANFAVATDLAPPAPTGLTALGGTQQVQLSWNASPATDFDYFIVERDDTEPADSFVQIATTTATAYFDTGLDDGRAYFYRIVAVDRGAPAFTGTALRSAPSSTVGATTTGVLRSPNGLAGIALSSRSISWSWEPVFDASFYTLHAYPSDAILAQIFSATYTESGLNPNTAYSRRVRTGSNFGASTPTAVATVYTHAARPVNLSTSAWNYTGATLRWNDGGNPDDTSYTLERSLDNVSFTAIRATAGLTHRDNGLTDGVTYYYRVYATNGDGLDTAPSATLTVAIPTKLDNLRPAQPLGFKGNLDPTGRAFTLIWEDVTLNDDLTPISDLAGYNIYRSTTPGGLGTLINSQPVQITAFADVVNSRVYYYRVRAVDGSGNESDSTLFADSSPQTNVTFMGRDGITSVAVPGNVNDLLRSGHNSAGVPLLIAMDEIPVPAGMPELVRHVRLRFVRSDTRQDVSGMAFQRPDATLSIGYNTINGQVARGEPASIGLALELGAAATADKLAIFWNNGNQWIKVGGLVDAAGHALRIRTSFLGDYQLRIAASATSLSLGSANVFPRTITPNGDGRNDRVYFVLENPNNASVTGEILDLAGRRVGTLRPPSGGAGIGTTLTWDGKDDGGSVVPAGAYIYKVHGEGKTFTGTVAVAR